MKTTLILLCLVFLGFVFGKTERPKYREGDCVTIDVFHLDKEEKWDSRGYILEEIKIVKVFNYNKKEDVYKFKIISSWSDKDIKKEFYMIPVKDLDNFTFAHTYWGWDKETNKDECNRYEENK